MECIKVEDLTFTYEGQDRPLLNGCSFTIEQGEFAVICGGSGCGKTTLLRLLKKELELAGNVSGSIRYYKNGIPIAYEASEVGYVMQDVDAQIVTDEVWHELAFGLENMGLPEEEIRLRVAETAHYFGMEEVFHKKTWELSGGQKQIINLASVLAMEPAVLLLDEPTAQLDPVMAEKFIATVKKLNEQLGITVIMVEHELEEVLGAADRLLLLEDGKIVADGSPREVIANHGDRMVESLPTAARMYHGLGKQGKCPMTEKEAREYLEGLHESGRMPKDVSIENPYRQEQKVAVELKEIYFRYEREGHDVLSAVSLSVQEGEIFSILGGNGSGKTTLLSVLSGQRRAYGGICKVYGKKLNAYKGNSLYVNTLAYLPQNPASLFVKNTVMEDLLEVCKVMEYTREESNARIYQLAKELGIEEELIKHPYDLSGGQRQRAGLVKVLLLNPRILLLDEPTKGLDGETKKAFASLLKTLNEKGMTIVMVTHDVQFAAGLSSRCGFFFDHDFLAIDTPKVLFSKNRFFTTAASRIMRPFGVNAITAEEIIACYQG